MALMALVAVFVTVAGAEEAGVTFTLSGTSHTTEEGGVMVIKVKLATEPTANVVIAVSSLDETEGTVWPSSLTFTSLNWNGYQELTVTGQDDDERDEKEYYTIRLDSPSSDDPDYAGRQPVEITTYNTDNDVPGITLDAALDEAGNPLLYTSEKGQQAMFTVRLNNAPTQDVVISVSSSDTGEGTVSPGELVFTSENWSGLQTVTITGVDDDIMDGDQAYAINLTTESADSGYNGLQPDKDISVINMDYGDTAGLTIGAVSGNTTEIGGQAEFVVSLTSEPVANVIISVSSLDSSEGTVSPASLTFTSENWSGLQTVTVTGIDDLTVDGHQSYMITLAVSSSDTNYTSLDIPDVEVVNEDDDIADFKMEIPGDGSLETTEEGGKASFAVKLTSKPNSDVTIGISSSDESEGTVFPDELIFTPENWNGMHTVTIIGVDDLTVDGNQTPLTKA